MMLAEAEEKESSITTNVRALGLGITSVRAGKAIQSCAFELRGVPESWARGFALEKQGIN